MYKKVVVHGGVFHADDALAVAALRAVLGRDIPLERRDPTPEETGNPEVIKLDVGGVFDVGLSAYDHHQRSFTLERDPAEGYGIAGEANPLAAAGLVWNQFTQQLDLVDRPTAVSGVWHQRVDALLFRGVDAMDCGKGKVVKGGSPTLSQIVHMMNPPAGAEEWDRDAAFIQAVELCTTVLKAVMVEARVWCDAQADVLAAPANAAGVLVLNRFVPWMEHIFARPDADSLFYVVFPSERGGFCVQQMPVEEGSFTGKKPLPETWAGLRGAELSAACGVTDAIFCHPGRFIGGAQSLEGTMKMADKARWFLS